MEQIIRIGMDTSKSVFQVHGVDAAERPVLRRKLARKEMIRFFEKLPPTLVAIEACASSHHWARHLTSQGHEVRLIAPQLVKPYVKRGKNDAADAEALCEAAGRPTMRFVPAVCEYVPQPREAPYDFAQHHPRTVTVPNVSRVDHSMHQISFGVGQDMAFAALDLLASVPQVKLRQPEDRLRRKDRRFPWF